MKNEHYTIKQGADGQRVASFELVYDQYRDRVYRYCRHLCRSKEDAEDLAQTTFMRAYQSYALYCPDHPLLNWLLRIAKNAFLDSKRTQDRRPRTISESCFRDGEGLVAVLDERPNAEELLLRRESEANLKTEIEHLDPVSKQLVIEVHLKSTPIEHMASAFSMNRATVRSRLFRARRTLRTNMMASQTSMAA